MKNIKALFLIAALLLPLSAFGNATFVIVNNDPPGVGFNDPTPVAPVGGNNGTTLGQQRLNAFAFAASIWGATVDSAVPIRIRANFGPLGCTATSATLGSAGARGIWANTPNIREVDTWYHVALANKQAGIDVAPIGNTNGSDEVDLAASFNANIGTPGCLQNSGGWYLGFDTNQTLAPNGGTRINLVAVLLHEFAHGIGFSTFVNRTNGQNVGFPAFPWPDVYQKRIFDRSLGMYWDQMSAAQRLTSRVNTGNLSWAGATVMAEAPNVLHLVPRLTISSSPGSGDYAMGSAEFGAKLDYPGLAGELVHAVDDANAAGPSTADGCTAILNNVQGKIAFVNRGTCGFAIKAANAQAAGAIGIVIADNVAGPVVDMAGSGNRPLDLLITIPAGRVTLATGDIIRNALTAGTVNVVLGADPNSVRRGMDSGGRVLLYAPNPFVSGSSTSHFDVTAVRNLLMEPSITGNLTHNLTSPDDLTLAQMRDIGWYPDADVDLVEDGDDNCPNTANPDQANYDGDAQGDACDADDDNDGVPDANDANPHSNMQPTVTFGACDSQAPNAVFPNGETMMDRIAAISAKNHGDFVSQVMAIANEAKDLGLITGAEHGAIASCAAKK
ncbi:MAG TPA: PA domain-containing protein [Thermoanaerobaculia bacterium]|nr:PA domain-containing protein [Thermoanaerobaculia bacterium]